MRDLAGDADRRRDMLAAASGVVSKLTLWSTDSVLAGQIFGEPDCVRLATAS